ncbi:ABC transporter ATP-binding protein [Streptomyces sulfonofaciens]|uniref:ABC transporter ATP-binding protein n=1 Tax=Streptomyces sulfonofaciens TaxID=68272 RepID=A0A919KTJ7_9ACTN|nr:oligopeptide/dipeptide ABC transporter ATP-binding protein [Streptomyces sulfonofaciens]GHH71922.1 ABC transporter ATP-binding protein [Streptomyces sulfonofaciens]
MTDDTPVLEVEGLVKHYRGRAGTGTVRAVNGVDLSIGRGEILGLVGESGSGKSTIGRCVARLTAPTAGRVRLLGQDISAMSRRELRPLRRDVHVVFQDAYSSLNPRTKIGDIVAGPLRQHREGDVRERRGRAAEMLERVGLPARTATRYPHELSGGQRQRVALARALVMRPRLVVADEPVSALDVSVQASILNLLLDLRSDLGFSCLFITHDLSVVEFVGDRIAVMYLGGIVETATRQELFAHPQHPYTQALLSAAPVPDPREGRAGRRVVLRGDLPSQTSRVPGCAFHTRCPVAVDRCRTDAPVLTGITAPDHLVSCHLVTPEAGGPDITQGGNGLVHHTS